MSEFAPAPPSAGRRAVPIAPLLRPQEHGVYGLYAEPVILGLALAPSPAGVALALAGAAAIVAQQPAALALADLRRGRRYPRTTVAGRLALLGAAAAVTALAVAALLAGLWPAGGPIAAWWAPILLALVPAGVQFAADRALKGKTGLAQTTGALALAALAPAIALAGGAPPALAWSAWGWLGLRVIVSIHNVRARLRLARGRPARLAPPRLAALTLPLGAAAGWAAGWLGALPFAVAVAIAARSLWTLRRDAPAVPAVRVGIAETIVGLLWVLALILGLQR